jgi:toxin CptA
MHGAPAVSYPVGRSRVAGALLLAAWAAGAAGVIAWLLVADPAPARWAACVAAVLIGGAVALHAWTRSVRGELAWSGEEWSWTRNARAQAGGLVDAVLDLQHTMLLRWQVSPGSAAGRWLWVERRTDPARWDALRRAVYSRARPESPRGARPGREGRT